jgi:hypothetical protein
MGRENAPELSRDETPALPGHRHRGLRWIGCPFFGRLNVVRAVDATSGRLIWSYDPKVTE